MASLSKSARILNVVRTLIMRAIVTISLSAVHKDPAVATLDVAFIVTVTARPVLNLQFPGPLHQILHG